MNIFKHISEYSEYGIQYLISSSPRIIGVYYDFSSRCVRLFAHDLTLSLFNSLSVGR